MNFSILTTLTPPLIKQWQNLSLSSPSAHLFNSYEWFSAFITSHPSNYALVAAFNAGELVGLIPLIAGKKYGVMSYINPGNHYSDRSPILVKHLEPALVNGLMKQACSLGNIYISEIPENIKVFFQTDLSWSNPVSSSSGALLPVTGEPFPKMSKEHRRRIRNKINQLGNALAFDFTDQYAVEKIPLLQSIEAKSLKKSQMKDMLSNPRLVTFLKELNRLNSKLVVVDVLNYEGEPICFQLGFCYQSIYSGFCTAYVSKYRHLMPGKIITYLLTLQLFKQGVNMIDMSRGDNDFKHDLSDNFYVQYHTFYSSSLFISQYWATLSRIKYFLDKHDRLFEITRFAKNYLQKFFYSVSKNPDQKNQIFNIKLSSSDGDL